MKIIDTIRGRLKHLRKVLLKLNQTDFAKSIMIAQTHLSSLEKGERNITDRTILDICREFNVSESWLRYGTGEIFAQSDNAIIDEVAKEYNLNDLQKEIVQDFVTLSPDDRKIVTDFIQLIKRQAKKEVVTYEIDKDFKIKKEAARKAKELYGIDIDPKEISTDPEDVEAARDFMKKVHPEKSKMQK